MYARTPSPTGSNQSQRTHTESVSDMLPASLLKMAASKTASPTLTANLIHPAPLISAFLSTSCPASNLVQTEVDNNGIATVSICVRFNKAGKFLNQADFEKGNLATLFLGKACQGPGQLPQPGTSAGGKILRRSVPAANRCEKEIFCNSCKLRRASGTSCRSWVRRWRMWRSPAPRLWSSHPLNQPSSPLDWISCKRRHLFYINVYLEWNWGMDDFTTESQGDVQTRHNPFSTVLVNIPGNDWRHWPRRQNKSLIFSCSLSPLYMNSAMYTWVIVLIINASQEDSETDIVQLPFRTHGVHSMEVVFQQ